MKLTNNLGEVSGKWLVFGGVYSNLQALLKMKAIAEEAGIPAQQVICTGDVVGYCAQPEETVQAVIDWGIHCIAGNVEIQLREGLEDCGCDFNAGSRCDIFSRQWYPFAQEQLSASSIEWMKTLPDFLQLSFNGTSATVVHGSWFETSGYVFASTPWPEVKENFSKTGSDLIIGGHCGLPFHRTDEEKTWWNPGVIGMPANDGTTRVWYGRLDSTSSEGYRFSHHSFSYDQATAAELMRTHKLPLAYAQTLETGLWDNCEILPEKETALQGTPIEF